MATTQPSQTISLTTVAIATTGVILSASVAYALYFDHRRRSDPNFRRELKKQHKKISKLDAESQKAAEKSQKERIKNVVDAANEEGFPKDAEETEQYFMQEVARGEGMCSDGSDPVEAALCFYKALKVYPQPRELIGIYDKTVPKVSSYSGIQGAMELLLTVWCIADPGYPRGNDRSRSEYICHRLRSRFGCWVG